MTDKIADELRAEGELLALQPELGDAFRRGTRIFAAADALDAAVRRIEFHENLWRFWNDKARNLSDALAAAHKRIAELSGGWQPIETAPKDGTEFLGIQYHGRFSDPGIVRWDDSDQEWWDMDADQYGFPTHWQPLPAPPSRLLNKEDRNG